MVAELGPPSLQHRYLQLRRARKEFGGERLTLKWEHEVMPGFG